MRLNSVDLAYLRQYEGSNIHYNDIGSDTTYIFFSSNGLYIDGKDDLDNVLRLENRFEWKKISKSLTANKIFVRDIYKSWYLCGINQKISSVELLLEELKKLTNGKHVVTVGSSAGGYAACLFGALLKADFSISFSGQFFLFQDDFVLTSSQKPISQLYYPFLFEFVCQNRSSPFFDTRNLLQISQLPVFYFYPSNSIIDKQQRDSLTTENVQILNIDAEDHGAIFSGFTLAKILQLKKTDLNILFAKFGNKINNHILIEKNILGCEYYKSLFMRIFLSICKKLKKYFFL